MIRTAHGNLLESGCQALVNTVNCMGVMGKGIALQFKMAYPEAYEDYRRACTDGRVVVGKMHVVDRNSFIAPQFIINFPTKRHWKGKSRVIDIRDGLADLVRVIKNLKITSIAIPPLGCGNGGLDWNDIGPMIRNSLADLHDADVALFEPGGTPANADMPIHTKRPTMTHGRAALLGLFGRYLLPGYHLTMLEVQKLAYFLAAAGEPLNITFEKQKYGPYAEKIHHVLQHMEGHFIRGYGDRSRDAAITLVDSSVTCAEEFLSAHHPETIGRRERVEQLIAGFENPYGLELLATVHWVATHAEERASSPESAVLAVHNWNEHKKQTFLAKHIHIAWEQLDAQGWLTQASSFIATIDAGKKQIR